VHHVVVMEDDVLVGIVSALDFVRRFAVDAEPGK
jgi:CBS domain-containing protein